GRRAVPSGARLVRVGEIEGLQEWVPQVTLDEEIHAAPVALVLVGRIFPIPSRRDRSRQLGHYAWPAHFVIQEARYSQQGVADSLAFHASAREPPEQTIL